jgi:hypothetical protein
MDLSEIGLGSVDWIRLSQDRDRWRAVVSAVMNLRVLTPELVSELWALNNLHRLHSVKLRNCRIIHYCHKVFHVLGLVACCSITSELVGSFEAVYHLLYQSVTIHFVFMDLARFSVQTGIISLNSIKQLIFVMVKCGVLFEVRTEFLNNI